MAAQALNGVRVLDLTHHIAGPFCTKLLADYGADVIKVERPGGGDPARSHGPFLGDHPHPERSGLFLFLNTNKRGITVNLKSAAGRQILLELARRADIVVESFHPRVLPSLHLDYPLLRSLHPELVMVSISNFGQTGPYRDWQASELVLYAMGHEMYSTGQPDAEPTSTARNVNLHFAGMAAAVAAVAAYYGARYQGSPQHVDVSIMEVLAGSIDRRADSLVAYQYCGEKAVRLASAMGIEIPPSINPCADGYFQCTVGVSWWNDFVGAVGLPMLQNPRFAPPVTDPAAREEFDRFWIPWCMARTKADIAALLQSKGVPAAPLNTTADLLADPHLRDRQFFIEVEHPAAGVLRYPGPPFRMFATPFAIRRAAPLLGQHNEEVLSELGYRVPDVVRLRETGAI
jgi:crotonobetainyl-CoA:carnitine CoA-transferase CaiB-like acyl-CoA transferase